MLAISNRPRALRSSDFEITRAITPLIIKITISSLAIGLKMSYFPMSNFQVVIGQFVIG